MSQPLATPGPGNVEVLGLVRSVIVAAMAESSVGAAYAAAHAAAEAMAVRDVAAVVAVFAIQSCGQVWLTVAEGEVMDTALVAGLDELAKKLGLDEDGGTRERPEPCSPSTSSRCGARVARRVAADDVRLNGRGLPSEWDVAINECRALAMTAYHVPPRRRYRFRYHIRHTGSLPHPWTEVGVAEAARRIGITDRGGPKANRPWPLDARKSRASG